ncbi:pilus assembly protein [Cycloclasticus pugetii]|uniref:pilus assembly protein n=1 Tax=Cycloclasticus pugetii TaxID=34068 RepID=UPI003A92EEB5
MNNSMARRFCASGTTFLASFFLAASSAYASVDIDQQPLLVAQPVPGNMAIVGSLEFPTMVSKANNTCGSRCDVDSGYNSTSTSYVGYFDNNKCYVYIWNSTESERHFSPNSATTNGVCAGDSLWSGKFLNWATTQAIDNFRSVMTGGYRVKDTTSETWLEKAWQDGQGGTGNFPRTSISGSSLIGGASPFTNWTGFQAEVIGRGNKLLFRRSGTTFANPVAFNPSNISTVNTNNNSGVYEVSVRVKVCVPGMTEANCIPYGNRFKPEGLVQANAENMRYSGFGYLGDGSANNTDNDINRNLDGGVMRARMKFVGEFAIDPEEGEVANPRPEWHPRTGVLYPDPDGDDSQTTTSETGQDVVSSGVINFINRSGQNFPEAKYKRRDNVSELYYAATRYFRNLGNYTNYTDVRAAVAAIPGLTDTRRAEKRKQLVDGLPVITNWDDPIQYSCQKNFILGIGDTNTADDRNLPGSPSGRAPNDDDGVNVVNLTNRVYSLEGVNQPANFNGSGSSPYMAGLAYHANATDIRDDIDGRQSVSTYWIDIVEFGDLKGRANNQYWLAAKYGGFRVPEDFVLADRTEALDFEWWKTNTDPALASNDPRPDNFYVVSNASEMKTSLTQAFSDIQTEQEGNRSSLALNSTTLESGSATFQAQYRSGVWTGDVNAFAADPDTGELSPAPVWSASSKLPAPNGRTIKTWNGNAFVNFFADDINNTVLTDALRSETGATAEEVVNYLRGVRTNETATNVTRLRVREGVLGDIVNSQPVFVGSPSPGLFRNQTFNGSTSYSSWASARSNRTPAVYVGGNDGMLHGFNATTDGEDSGVETFAYVPKAVIENGMGELASPAYDHRYFVDGELTVADAYDGSEWRTILVGTLGAGGLNSDRNGTNNALFALDVTDPENVDFLWEKSSSDIEELGINLGKPVIAQIGNGDWSVLLGNGPNSSQGFASLISVDLFSGVVDVTNMSTDVENGMSAVRAWDANGDGITDTIYAGDIQGNLWKVTGLVNNNPTVVKLFQAVDPGGVPQPITASPLAGRSPYSQEVWLFFGTGQYLSSSDLADTQVQTWYGINDNGATALIDRTDDLVEREILQDVVFSEQVTARVIEEGAREDLRGKRGWFIDLFQVGPDRSRTALGERMITPNQFQGSALISNTRIPDASDPCNPTGRGVIMSIDPFTGARLFDTYFDLDGDRAFDTVDMVEIDGVPTIVSGIGLNTGFSNPSFLDEKMYIPTDDGGITDIAFKGQNFGAGRTSWRELINQDN